jgi:hydrogenase maturation protein HypF
MKSALVDKLIECPFNFDSEILALGGQLKSTFGFAANNCVLISKPFGDLEDLGSFLAFEDSIQRLRSELKIIPKLIACDLHPDYISTKYAHEYIRRCSGSRLVGVQHHHAHIAACMADNNIGNRKVIGVAFDGTGFGTDANIWGGEFLLADYSHFERVAFFDYISLPGGVQAIREPWRMAAAYLYNAYKDGWLELKIDFVKRLDKQKWSVLKKMIDSSINSPFSSSVGRLFDAVSSLVGIRDIIEYEGQAAIELEKAIGETQDNQTYPYNIHNHDGSTVINPLPIIRGVVSDLSKGLRKSNISVRFHNTIVKIIVDVVRRVAKVKHINYIALSGGVFQNRYLCKRALEHLTGCGFVVLTHNRVSATDAGICLGQAAVARYRGLK